MKPLLAVTPCAPKSRQQSCKIREQQQCQERGKILSYKGERGKKSLRDKRRRKEKDDSDLLTKSDSNGLNFPKKAENGLNFPKKAENGLNFPKKAENGLNFP